MKCKSCHRTLRREPVFIEGYPFGPVCAASIMGYRPKRGAKLFRRRARDERQGELFTGVAA